MKITYSPKDAAEVSFVFKPLDSLSLDGEAIEAAGGDLWDNYDGFIEALSRGKLRALRAVLWLELRKENPKLRFPELVIGVREISYGPDADEVEEFRQRVADDETLTDEEKADLLKSLGKGDAEEVPSESSENGSDSSSLEPDSEV